MMFALISFCASLKPVILVPGTYASVLQFTGSNSDLQWYCPKEFDHETVWVAEEYFIPPVLNCLTQWIAVKYDNKTNTQTSMSGYDVDVLDFGHVSGVTHLDRFVFNISFIPYFSKLVKVFHNHGYADDITIFGAPHDWRFGISNQEVLWPRLKDLIETVHKSTGEKAILLGHSFGGFVVHHFISIIAPSRYSEEWLKEHVDRGIELSPSFGGAGSAVEYAYLRALHYVIEIKWDLLAETLESMGCIHTHFPNYELQKLHGDPTVIIDPTGKEYKASEVPQFLIDHQKINGDNIKLLNLMVPYLKEPPKPSLVKEIVFYNSRRETTTGIMIGDWDKDSSVTKIIGRGDGTVMADNIEAYCDYIANSNLTKCIDLNDDSLMGSHFEMLFDSDKLEQFYQATLYDDYK